MKGGKQAQLRLLVPVVAGATILLSSMLAVFGPINSTSLRLTRSLATMHNRSTNNHILRNMKNKNHRKQTYIVVLQVRDKV